MIGLDALEIRSLPQERPIGRAAAALLESIHLLTAGVDACWADARAVHAMGLATWSVRINEAAYRALERRGVIERLSAQPPRQRERRRATRFGWPPSFVRLTEDGLIEQHSLRPDYLPLLHRAAA